MTPARAGTTDRGTVQVQGQSDDPRSRGDDPSGHKLQVDKIG